MDQITFSEMDKKRGWVIEALVKQGCAQAEVLTTETMETAASGESVTSTVPEVTLHDLNETLVELQKFADLNDTKVSSSVSVFHSFFFAIFTGRNTGDSDVHRCLLEALHKAIDFLTVFIKVC